MTQPLRRRGAQLVKAWSRYDGMTCRNEPHQHDYRTLTATGNLTAFLHRHNRPLIIAVAVALVVAILAILIP